MTDLTMTGETDFPWREEWRAYRLRCAPAFGDLPDEAAFFEELRVVGGWYLVDGEHLILCVDRKASKVRRDMFIAALRRQGIEATVDGEGRGLARRDERLVLQEYRIEIGSFVYQKKVGGR